MGTILQVTVVADDAATAKRLAAAAIATARHWDDVLTTWRPEGELARLNARAGTGWVTVSADLASAIAQMERFTTATGGGFDPAVGAIVRLWRGPAAPPADALAALGPHRFAVAVGRQDGRVTLTRGTELDAGAIGKGIAIDAIVALLRRDGARAAFVNFGGSSQHAFGAPPDDPSGWRIAVAGMREGEVLGTLVLDNASLSTSRAIGRAAEAGPIIDPRNGVPVPAPRLATVIAADATTANAWSTGLIVLGRAGLARAAANGVHALIGDADGVERTAGFPLEP